MKYTRGIIISALSLFYFLALRCLALVRLAGAEDSCSLSVLAAAGGALERVVLTGAFGIVLDPELEDAWALGTVARGVARGVGFGAAGAGASFFGLPCRSPMRRDAMLPEANRSIHLGTIMIQLYNLVNQTAMNSMMNSL